MALRCGSFDAKNVKVIPRDYVNIVNPRGKRSCKVGNTIQPRNWGVQGSF